MAGEDGEDDGIDDDGMPPADPRLRVWTQDQVDAAASAPPTAEERARFGIPAAALAEQPRYTGPILAPVVSSADAPANPVVMALVAKFPNFNPDWPETTQAAWFAAFSRLLDAGLR